ncbi:ricin-type beta-trefoil lectin domain protein [Streptomyces sp. NPDC048384]|uniref:ricin-type beta-trefoil lectin domain protein n=1 Tax=Streptomyces sp. NPDC048384 TaxID=3155487 RepID=UPI003433C395
MTRPVQHTPTSARSESGSDGEETAATAATAVAASATEPEPEPAGAKTGTEAGAKAGESEATAVQAKTTEAEAESEAQSESEAGTESGAEAGSRSGSEADTDPGAAAAAKSRLPALVRTMTVTAIDRPQQEAGQVGRPGRAALAGAAVAGALLVSVPFLVLAGGDDKDNKTAPAGGTVLGGGSPEAPGDFVVTEPDASASGDGKKESAKPDKPAKGAPGGTSAQNSGKDTPKQDAGQKDRPKGDSGQQDQPEKPSGGNKSGGDDKPANTGSGVTFSAPVSLRSHLSGRCIDVPNAEFGDGKQLMVWDCNNGPAQRWQFASDGTVRINGLCLDVANANYNDGTPIQIAWCSGNAAQKFVLNERHDLVNTVVGKCVDIKDNNRGNGAWLQLWTCAGTDNQKWSV